MSTVLEALNHALASCLSASEDVYFLGEDILEPYGGAFKVARGLSTSFPERVISTPVSEAGIVGVGVGMALRGLRPVVEIMFGDFVTLAADQLINHAAKLRWMSADQVSVPLVVRTPMGGRRGYGPTHSQTLEKHFLGTPGLRVVAVSALDDPGKLLQQAVLEDDDPVLFVEHKLLYARPVISLNDQVEFHVTRQDGRYPTYHLELAGSPSPVLTLAAYGYMAELARETIQRLAYEHEIFCELVVPTQLSPFELRFLETHVSRTRRLLTLEEGSRPLGWGAEVVARLHESAIPALEARRLAAWDMPVPAAAPLEEAVLPGVDDIQQAVKEMVS
ncbi:MAG: alpha-ketoacid dehydrogenase subunit beta [Anaerolineales bacterium]|nr:alpha-ketoacid dehydrogenase subunit beta [Anaerolineales bacterium]